MKLNAEKGCFSLSFNNKTLFEHSSAAPAVMIGSGEGRYDFHFGLFKIRNRRLNMRGCGGFKVLESSEALARIRFECGLEMMFEEREGRIHLSFPEAPEGTNRLKLTLPGRKGEHLYGCGEQYSKLDLKGQKLPVWVQEPGLGRGKDLITLLAELKQHYGGNAFTTYFSQPTYLSSDNLFFHSEGTAYAEFDFRSDDRQDLMFWEVPPRIILGAEDTAQKTLSSLSAFLGRQISPPDWVYDGMWIGMQGGRDVCAHKLQDARDAGVKVSAIWCQDWEGIRITSFGKQLFWDWKPNEDLYPGFTAYTEELKKEGVRYLGYINPFLALEGPLYAEAKEKNYCVKNAQGEDYYVYITTFPAAMVDLTNPEAFEWIKDVIKRDMIGKGLSGWMADFGEYVPADAVLHSGVSAEVYHNQYAADWARANYEAVKEAGKEGEVTFFMRAGYTGSQKYSAMNWNGDQLVNWSFDQGFATVIPGTLSMGFSGLGYVHSDLGGYTTVYWLKRSRELFMRWAEHSAFTQVMRTHEGNRPDSNVQFNHDKEVLAHLARMTDIYVTLKPYHKALSDEYQATGLPPVRHPYLHYEGDEILHSLKYQYMYGADLLAAPVVKKGKKKWKVYLPKDKWTHLWSGREYEGGWATVEAPLGQLPVFYRCNSSWKELFKELRQC